jgi:hypothetical protein
MFGILPPQLQELSTDAIPNVLVEVGAVTNLEQLLKVDKERGQDQSCSGSSVLGSSRT